MCSSKNLLTFAAVLCIFVKLLKDISLMRKILFTLLCAFSALFFLPNAVTANTVTVDGPTGTNSTYLPVALHTNTTNANFAFHSVSQQLYYASELAGASSNTITAITFDYVGTTMAGRKIAVLINSTSLNSFPLPNEENPADEANKTPNMVDPGQRVFSGDVNMVDHESYTITFDTPYEWDGTSNIIVTVLDSTAKKNSKTYYPDATIYTVQVKIFETSGKVRFLHKTSKDNSDYASKGWDMNNLTAAKANSSSVDNRKYANRITFTFAAAPVAPSVPEDLAASNVGSTSASLSWSAVDGATSYDLYNSTSIDGVYSKFASPTTNSFEWSGLTASTTYFVKVAAVNDAGSSALSEPLYFTTQAPHIHDGITFEPWSNPAALPTSGNYFLNTDVALASDWNVTENINLCLNGHEVYTETNCIQVKDEATFAIYDNEGGGRIYGYFVADYPKYGLINIENGGTLVLSEGTIQNLYGSYEEDDDPDDKSLSNAIYNNGTLKLSGALTFTSYHADIYLGSNKYITIESEKPLTNSEPYSVYKSGKSVITSGWANMNGADPKDYFVSANTSLNIKMGETEAEFYPVISLSENNTNTAIGTYSGQMVDVNLTRSLTSSQFNTFCLPFALSNAQLEDIVGAGYDLEEFVSSSLEGDVLSLEFSKVTSLEAGKPYLLQPSVDVANPSFEGVTIAVTAPVDQTSDANISFHGTFAPTELQGGNENLLFLGAGNELFWPEATGNLKGFRAYFEVKGGAAKVAKRARIVQKGEQTQAIDLVENPNAAHKRIIDGQLVIEKNGMLFNAQGQMVK